MLRNFRKCASANVLVALLLAAATSAFALDPNRNLTQYAHRIWQAQPGLRQSSIYAITQSRDGYLWLGTQTGVVRFDGIQFTPVPALDQNGFEDTWALNFVEDPAGHMWILNNDSDQRHVIRIDGTRAHQLGPKDGLPSEDMSCLTGGRSGDMWLCGPTGLTHVESGAIHNFEYPQSQIPENRQTVVCQSNDGTVWTAGRGSSVIAWNGSAFSTRKLASVPPATVVRALACRGDELWVGTSDGLVVLKGDQETLYGVKEGLPDSVIFSLVIGTHGSVWIGTRKGFSRYRDGEFANYDYRDGLSQSTVYAIYEDRENSMWVATKNGLNQFTDGPTISYTTRDGLPSNNMGPILEEGDGHIWGGTIDAGLFRFDGRHVTTVNTTQGLASNSVTTLLEDAGANLWVGTSRGLNRLKEGQVIETFGTDEGLPSERIRSLFLDHAGRLWAGTSLGVARLEGGRFVRPAGLESLRANIVAMGETKDGRMIFAAEHGNVYVLENGRLGDFGGEDSRVRDVATIYTDPDGYVWMGTYGGGLGLWRKGNLKVVVTRDGLSDNQIFGIVPDGDRLWMACSKGFFSVSRAGLLAFADGKAKKVVSVPYSPLDRLDTVESQTGVQPVAWKGRNGQLWFSTIRGLLAFNPHRRADASVPPVAIDSVTVNGQTVDPRQIARLAPGPKTVIFDYTALSFVQPEQLTFSYRLQGYDRNWIRAGTRREAVYSNLPPGNFQFQVAACGTDGPCNDAGTSIAFSLAPAFYQHYWFYPLCLVIVGMLGWLLYQARIQQLRDQLALVAGERSRIARELHDTLIQGFSGITMQMQALSTRLRSPEEKRTLEEIIRDAGTCLTQTRQSVAGLRASAGSSKLASALTETVRQLTQEKDVRVRLKLDEKPYDLPAEVKYNLLRIAQEAITNSVKHSGARNIEVELRLVANDVRLAVRDDGRGFVRNGDTAGDTGHYGIIGMRERASHVGAAFELASSPGRGTTVSVRVPLEKDTALSSIPNSQEIV